MRFFKDLIKGACIGISNIIPGFSGGTMAVMLHIYDRIIYGLADIIHHPIKVIKDLIWILLGMVIGMVGAIFTISYMLDKFPFPTIMLFVGLIIGSIPGVFVEGNKENKSKLNYLWAIPAIVMLVVLAFVNTSDKSTQIGFVPLTIIFVMGIVASATMVVPGVSGSLTLMAFGYYVVVIDDIKLIMKNIASISSVKNEIVFIIFFGLGCVIGLILVSKLIKLLLAKFRNQVYFFITGLLLASIFTIIYSIANNSDYSINWHSAGMWICSIILFSIGVSVPLVMEYISKKYFKTNEVNGEE